MNKPEVILIAAISIDGFIAPADKESLPSTTWTSKEDWHFFTKKSKEIGTLIMGSKTFETFKRALPERKIIVMTSKPERYVDYKDESLSFTKATAEEILADLTKQGCERAALCGGSQIYNLFMQKGLVDRMFLTIEPFVFGEGIKLFNGKNEQKFELVSQEKLNESGTLVLEYAKVV
jgi:dihydrofolate reductase